MLVVLALLALPVLLAYAAVSDMLTMTISNRLCLAIFAAFFLAALVVGLPWLSVGMNLSLSILVLALTFGMFAAGWMGGGDAKLAAATMLWIGVGGATYFVFVTALAGGALTLLILAVRAAPIPEFVSRWSWCQRLHNANSGVPYGIALAVGGMVAFPHTEIWRLANGL